ncbi:hypothetical protein GIB67_001229 [Kingdonia uniflora]|uniref:Uncharacterized protein n=1 Tax=Kingdonia uniflora TaxID=39325 RepID=A0A7J7LGA7_9MAGN|nr:hypothetical protein GIB67_001229 [Kingdonia uniflora]
MEGSKVIRYLKLLANSSTFEQKMIFHNHFTGISDGLPNSPRLQLLFSNNFLSDIKDYKFIGNILTWLNALSNLKIFLLKGNNLQSRIPIQLCQLNKIAILDLSHNNLSGSLSSCLKNISFAREGILDGYTQILTDYKANQRGKQKKTRWQIFHMVKASPLKISGKKMKDFAKERDWEKYRCPRKPSLSLCWRCERVVRGISVKRRGSKRPS